MRSFRVMNLKKGTKYLIKEELKTLCCPYVFRPGETLEISRVASPNRLLVVDEGSGLHKVKRSSLNRTSVERE